MIDVYRIDKREEEKEREREREKGGGILLLHRHNLVEYDERYYSIEFDITEFFTPLSFSLSATYNRDKVIQVRRS